MFDPTQAFRMVRFWQEAMFGMLEASSKMTDVAVTFGQPQAAFGASRRPASRSWYRPPAPSYTQLWSQAFDWPPASGYGHGASANPMAAWGMASNWLGLPRPPAAFPWWPVPSPYAAALPSAAPFLNAPFGGSPFLNPMPWMQGATALGAMTSAWLNMMAPMLSAAGALSPGASVAGSALPAQIGARFEQPMAWRTSATSNGASTGMLVLAIPVPMGLLAMLEAMFPSPPANPDDAKRLRH